MYLAENDFPVSVRTINTKNHANEDYVVFSHCGQSLLKISKSDWCKFTPNPSLNTLCTSPLFQEILYKDIYRVQQSILKKGGDKRIFNIIRTYMAMDVLNHIESDEYISLLVQIATTTETNEKSPAG